MSALPSTGTSSIEEMKMQQQQQAEMEEKRVMILDQILEPEAKERLRRLSIVKKEKARFVEDQLIKAATTGQLRTKVTEEQLIQMLEGGGDSAGSGGGTKGVVIKRRNYGIEEDDDDDDSDLM